MRLSPDPCQTSANPGDVDNAILNLAINARDAMPSGGMLTIETRLVSLDADVAGRIANARPGEYVMLTVSDTGHGMSPEVLKHAMEPFFTTKEPGKGTGLGLATVHSTVRQSGGFVAIDSTEGEGTSVHLYFPKAEPGPIVSRAAPSPKEAPLGDGELILLVEDNDKVREATVNRLESLGYAVLEAKTGPEAITLLKSGEPIALVFSDIVMPGGMTGYDVAEWVRSMKPEVKVLLTTGYSEMPLAVSEAARKIKVLGKPYTREQLGLRTPRSTRRLTASGLPSRPTGPNNLRPWVWFWHRPPVCRCRGDRVRNLEVTRPSLLWSSLSSEALRDDQARSDCFLPDDFVLPCFPYDLQSLGPGFDDSDIRIACILAGVTGIQLCHATDAVARILDCQYSFDFDLRRARDLRGADATRFTCDQIWWCKALGRWPHHVSGVCLNCIRYCNMHTGELRWILPCAPSN